MSFSIKNKVVLVTGGAGFIGSHLAGRLITSDCKVICVDNFDAFYARTLKENNINKLKNNPQFIFIEADIRDKNKMSEIFSNYSVSIVVHLAAKAGVRPSVINPQEFYDVNVAGTLTLLDVMKHFSVKNLVFSSSSSVYGNNPKIPYSETDNVDFPISPYAATKKAGELLTHTYHYLYDFNVINLRFFTVYGPWQRPDLAIHKFFKNLYNNISIEIYGDGSTSRDYTYIEDTVSGIIASINYLLNNKNVYEIINIGNSNPIKLNDLVDLIENTCGRKFIRKQMPMQEGDVNQTFADVAKAKDLLGYNPHISIEAGLQKFKKWYEENNT